MSNLILCEVDSSDKLLSLTGSEVALLTAFGHNVVAVEEERRYAVMDGLDDESEQYRTIVGDGDWGGMQLEFYDPEGEPWQTERFTYTRTAAKKLANAISQWIEATEDD